MCGWKKEIEKCIFKKVGIKRGLKIFLSKMVKLPFLSFVDLVNIILWSQVTVKLMISIHLDSK